MRKLFVLACCVSMLSGVTVASAQSSSPQVPQSVKSSDTTDISARKKMKRMKKGMMGTKDKSKMGGEPPSGSAGSKKGM